MLLFKADHKSFSIDELEKLRQDEEEFYKKHKHCVLVQTCNRIEIYFDDLQYQCMKECKKGLNNDQYIAKLIEEFKNFEVIRGKESIIHFLNVACGIESMVIGEDQILGQIKKSLQSSKEKGKCTKYLELVFLKGIHVGQRVRAETKINEGSVSIGSAALELVEKNFGLENKNILLIGAGEMGTLVAKTLAEKNIKAVIISNRTYERAERLAKELKGIAINFDKLKEAINYSDVIICATASPHTILHKKDLEDIQNSKSLGAKIIVDIANPRDVEESVSELESITLYTIDNLREVSDTNLKKRMEEMPKVHNIINQEYDVLLKNLEKLDIEEILKDLNNYLEEIRVKELNKAIKLVKNNPQKAEEIFKNFSKSLTKKISHDYVNYSCNTSKDKLINSVWWKNEQ
ncbi:glutamyl-tRNA reductase [Methanococcus voltae]|uniref:glutamyl-tRNA reductase n=1 Tax=Methanococcus voltae TaxID=2188 RepID=UPI001AE3D435|nr:glutamyl-tRNA reductase [Methanococcus voltae]MBP2144326.1 glutamyl-tRNA reductase [Methanococcus voltae]